MHILLEILAIMAANAAAALAIWILISAFRSSQSLHPAFHIAAWSIVALCCIVSLVVAWYDITRIAQCPAVLDRAYSVLLAANGVCTHFLAHRNGRMLGRSERPSL